MLEEKIQNLAETDKGSYYNQEEWLEEFLDDKGTFYNGSESDDSKNDYDNYKENIKAFVLRCFSNQALKRRRKFNRKTPVLEFLFNKVEQLY